MSVKTNDQVFFVLLKNGATLPENAGKGTIVFDEEARKIILNDTKYGINDSDLESYFTLDGLKTLEGYLKWSEEDKIQATQGGMSFESREGFDFNNQIYMNVGEDSKKVATEDFVTTRGYKDGTVKSVSLSLPDIFNVSGSPVVTGGTLSATFKDQLGNLFLASPIGKDGEPKFRAITNSDLPALITRDVSGNAGSATKLKTAQKIKIGKKTISFDGSSDITYNLDDILGTTAIGFIKRSGENRYEVVDDSIFATQQYVNSKISSVYKVKGSKSPGEIYNLTASASNLGEVYNVTGTLIVLEEDIGHGKFIGGSAGSYPPGTNVVITEVEIAGQTSYRKDILSGVYDLSGEVENIQDVVDNKIAAALTTISETYLDLAGENTMTGPIKLGGFSSIEFGQYNSISYNQDGLLFNSDRGFNFNKDIFVDLKKVATEDFVTGKNYITAAALNGYAKLASPLFTGTPKLTGGTNANATENELATAEFVINSIKHRAAAQIKWMVHE